MTQIVQFTQFLKTVPFSYDIKPEHLGKLSQNSGIQHIFDIWWKYVIDAENELSKLQQKRPDDNRHGGIRFPFLTQIQLLHKKLGDVITHVSPNINESLPFCNPAVNKMIPLINEGMKQILTKIEDMNLDGNEQITTS